MSLIEQIEQNGFAILENSVDNNTLELLEKELQRVEIDHHASPPRAPLRIRLT